MSTSHFFLPSLPPSLLPSPSLPQFLPSTPLTHPSPATPAPRPTGPPPGRHLLPSLRPWRLSRSKEWHSDPYSWTTPLPSALSPSVLIPNQPCFPAQGKESCLDRVEKHCGGSLCASAPNFRKTGKGGNEGGGGGGGRGRGRKIGWLRLVTLQFPGRKRLRV